MAGKRPVLQKTRVKFSMDDYLRIVGRCWDQDIERRPFFDEVFMMLDKMDRQ